MSNTRDWKAFSAEIAANAASILDAKDNNIATLRQQLAKSKERVAELEDLNEPLWETFAKVADYLDIDYKVARKIPGKPSDVFRSAILRKQAKAMEVIANKLEGMNLIRPDEFLRSNAQSLRQQADDIEKEGSDDE